MDENKWSNTENGKSTTTTIYYDISCRDTRELPLIYTYMFKLLCIVDANWRLAIDFVYDMLEYAKNEIKLACNRTDTTFTHITDIVEK